MHPKRFRTVGEIAGESDSYSDEDSDEDASHRRTHLDASQEKAQLSIKTLLAKSEPSLAAGQILLAMVWGSLNPSLGTR